MIMHFKDRHEAGIKLAEQLKKYKENKAEPRALER